MKTLEERVDDALDGWKGEPADKARLRKTLVTLLRKHSEAQITEQLNDLKQKVRRKLDA